MVSRWHSNRKYGKDGNSIKEDEDYDEYLGIQ
jgi:hypothetical protein